MSRVWVIVSILAIQVLSAFFFVSDILSSYVGFSTEPLAWEVRELLELAAALGLGTGVVFGAFSLWRVYRDKQAAETRLRVASGAFMDMLNARFHEWKLTRAEADVALFAIKGLSTAEIAVLRKTSEGTVKAQTNAIYRKAGVSGRPQLLSLFIDELIGEDNIVRASLASPASQAVNPIPPMLPPPSVEEKTRPAS
jgi:DNA-binding CsgD family transcriptional regulator